MPADGSLGFNLTFNGLNSAFFWSILIVVVVIIIIIYLFTAIGLLPGGSGYFACKQNTDTYVVPLQPVLSRHTHLCVIVIIVIIIIIIIPPITVG